MDPQLRNKVLAEWRGLPVKKPAPDRLHSIQQLVTGAMQKLGLADRLHEAEVLAAWKEIVGDFLAAHSFPSRLREGVLYVQVVQSTVHYELDRNCKAQILDRLKKRFGARRIREVRFRAS